MPGSSGHHQSDEKKRGSDGGHHIPHETKGPGKEPGWPREEPCLETVALTSQMKRRVAVMVAHHIPHETKGPGRKTWVAYTQLQGGRAIPGSSGPHQPDEKKSGSDGGHHIPHETRGPGREPGWPTLNYKEEEPCL